MRVTAYDVADLAARQHLRPKRQVAEVGVGEGPAAVVGPAAHLAFEQWHVGGYDDAANLFIIRNSWGTTWGQKGYGTIPYAYLIDPSLSADLWTIRVIEA